MIKLRVLRMNRATIRDTLPGYGVRRATTMFLGLVGSARWRLASQCTWTYYRRRSVADYEQTRRAALLNSRLIADHPILLAVITLLVFLVWMLPQWLGGVWPLIPRSIWNPSEPLSRGAESKPLAPHVVLGQNHHVPKNSGPSDDGA